jgi:hypothetical protein
VTVAIPTYGSKLSYSTDGVHYTTVAQLRKFSLQGSKQTIVDQTNILSAGNASAPLAVRFDSGEASMDGVLSPADGTQLALGTYHASLTLLFWKLVLSDGVTTWTFQGFLSEFVPWLLDIAKAVTFSAKIRISGALTGPAGTA